MSIDGLYAQCKQLAVSFVPKTVMKNPFAPFSGKARIFSRRDHSRGFALVVTLSLMILLTIVAVGLLGLASVEMRKSSGTEARSIAMANARLGLILALGQLQSELGDDRRISADASLFQTTKNPAAVGVWNGWSPDLGARSGSGSTARVDYRAPKSQTGFRSWLVSHPDPTKPRLLDWHSSDPAANAAELFTQESSGFDLAAEKVPVNSSGKNGTLAWAVTQENTKARINIGVDDSKRISLEDQMQSPSRPNLSLSTLLKQPDGDWNERASKVIDLQQASLDQGYGITREMASIAARDFTVHSFSLLTNPVKGGLKTDLSTGFDMSDTEFAAPSWDSVNNPFRSTIAREYDGQKPLFQPMGNNAQAQVFMSFDPANVNHKFQTNGVATYDTLRAHYRTYRHLYNSSGATTAFERPYSHASTPEKVAGRPFGDKSHPALAPVLDRVCFALSVYAKSDGILCILLTPYVTIWNPHNVDIETEGLVVYPWIDMALIWDWNITEKNQNGQDVVVAKWNSSLSRFVGEGFQGHGRSTRPYFYLHLTQSGNPVSPGAKTVSPAIHLEPGEVRMFCLADKSPRELDILGGPAARTWRMKPVANATDFTSSNKGGVALNMTRSIGGGSNFNHQVKSGQKVSGKVSFDRNEYFYIVNMADAHHIKNPNAELMVEARPAFNSLPALPAEKNLYFYSQIHADAKVGRKDFDDVVDLPSWSLEEIRNNPKLVGGLLTYHRVAQSGGSQKDLPLADLMFTTNPRQPIVNQYLSGASFQSGPHYESILLKASTLAGLNMETTPDGKKAFYGASHSVSTGRSNLAFFEIPRSPTLSLGSFQHCDISTTAFNVANQIGNSWASPYLDAASVSKRVTVAPGKETITPLLAVFDHSYLANEALFDSTYLSGAAPAFGSRKSATGSPAIWLSDQISETKSTADVLRDFFSNPAANPLRNPRMYPYTGAMGPEAVKARVEGPASCVRLAAHLMIEGGFNINSTSEEAWTAVLASLRGAEPASGDKTAQSRFRHILTGAPANMAENDPWSGFRTLSDTDLKALSKAIVAEVKTRGPFLSLGEFVNRRVSGDRGMNLAGAIQTAIDNSGLNKGFSYGTFATGLYPNPGNITNPNTGTNTPGWLSQADILHALAPCIAARSDTFTVRTIGEAKAPDGTVLATVRLEAVVQRVPDWIDPQDVPETSIADLKSTANKKFGRKFQVISVRELTADSDNNPI